MNLYTLFYQSLIGGHYVPYLCRVWADSPESARERCCREFGEVFAIVAGHPEILDWPAEVPTYDWGTHGQ